MEHNPKMAFAAAIATFLLIASEIHLAAAVVRVCVPKLAPGNVAACDTALNLGQPAGSFVCVSGATDRDCMTSVKNSQSDVVRLGGDQMYDANAVFELQPVVAEAYSNGLPSGSELLEYYSVAVIKKELCDALGPTTASFADLKGKYSCHTGYRRTAGWTLPMGHMISKGIMPVTDLKAGVAQDAESVATFFGKVCAAGTTNEGPAIVDNVGAKYDNVCDGCAGTCAGNATENFFGYPGALRCLMEGGGDVAWVKHTTPVDYAQGGPNATTWSTIPSSGLRLLCPGGGCKPIEEFNTCKIAQAASHAFMARPGFKATPEGAVGIPLLVAANAAWLAGAVTQGVVTPDAKSLREVADPTNFASHFGTDAVASFKGIRELKAAPAPAAEGAAVRLCIPSAPKDVNACNAALNAGQTPGSFECVYGNDPRGCMNAVKDNTADLVRFGGDQMYDANSEFKLQPIVAETYSQNGLPEAENVVEYYSVAVIKKQLCDALGPTTASFRDLEGKGSCHTGYRRNAGWMLPVGSMISSGVMKVADRKAGVQQDAESVAEFFGTVCAPGQTPNGPALQNNAGVRYEELCNGCKGSCNADNVTETFFDYPGALKCLMEGAGDVAFVKQTTPIDYAKGGKSAQPWSSIPQSELRLLCPGGGCKPIDEFGSCQIARAASHAFMGRPGFATQPAGVRAISLLTAVDATWLKAALGQAVVTKDATGIRAVREPTNFASHFGQNGVSAFASIRALSTNVDENRSSGGGGSNGVAPGAVAGIAIGCAVAGAILTALVMMMLNRRNKNKFSNFNQDSSSPQNVPFKV